MQPQVITSRYPETGSNFYPVDLGLVVPMVVYDDIVQQFSQQNTMANRMFMLRYCLAEDQVATAQKQADAMLAQVLPPEDYHIRSVLDARQENRQNLQAFNMIIAALGGFLALIGIASAFAAVSGNLAARSRTFGVLRSNGLGPRQFHKMLRLEGLLLSLLPVLFSIPIFLTACGISASFAPHTTLAQLLAAAPWGIILLCILLIVLTVFLAYALASRRAKKTNIIDSIRDQTL